MSLEVGALFPSQLGGGSMARAAEMITMMGDEGLDHVVIGDHVSFFGGFGLDGLVASGALAMLHPRLGVCTAVYQLPLRHPVPVARQVATIAGLAPGRFTFGVGLGGDDRHELEICGVDPKTRGRRMDECLQAVRDLLTGEEVSLDGEFISYDKARITPAPPEPVRILVGGRADAAFRRTARWGDGWIALWVTPTRFAEGVAAVEAEAASIGRVDVDWQHSLTLWCGYGDNKDEARAAVAKPMQRLYGRPFEAFEKYTPYGTPEHIAEFLVPFIDAGCGHINLLGRSATPALAVKGAADVRRLLRKHYEL